MGLRRRSLFDLASPTGASFLLRKRLSYDRQAFIILMKAMTGILVLAKSDQQC